MINKELYTIKIKNLVYRLIFYILLFVDGYIFCVYSSLIYKILAAVFFLGNCYFIENNIKINKDISGIE